MDFEIFRKVFTETEMEENYTILTMALTIDMSSINQRLGKQKRHLQCTELAMATAMEALLELVNQGQDADSIVPRVEELARVFSHVSASAEQFGAIQQEKKVLKCVAFVHNYVGVLKGRLSGLSCRCQSTE